jgi:hypothetical protein
MSAPSVLFWVSLLTLGRDAIFHIFYMMFVMGSGTIIAPVTFMIFTVCQGGLDAFILGATSIWYLCSGEANGKNKAMTLEYMFYYALNFFGEIWMCTISLYWYVAKREIVGGTPNPTDNIVEYLILLVAYMIGILWVNPSNIMRWLYMAKQSNKGLWRSEKKMSSK